MPPLKSIAPNTKFGEWTVLRIAEKRTGYNRVQYICRCECGTEKAIDAANLRNGRSKNCRKGHGMSEEEKKTAARVSLTKYRNKPGIKERDSVRSSEYNSRPEIKIKIQNRRISKTYGITVADKKDILRKQNYLCALCNEPFVNEASQAIDHDHNNGQVRGIIHKQCNSGLGLFGDSVEKLEKAIIYLKRYV